MGYMKNKVTQLYIQFNALQFNSLFQLYHKGVVYLLLDEETVDVHTKSALLSIIRIIH